jgi:hypothetical protein
LEVNRRSYEGVVVGSAVSLFVDWLKKGKNRGMLLEGVQYLPFKLEGGWKWKWRQLRKKRLCYFDAVIGFRVGMLTPRLFNLYLLRWLNLSWWGDLYIFLLSVYFLFLF